MKTRAIRCGFTLIELLVVIAIIGTLAAIIVPLAGKAKQSTLKRRATLEMNSIKMAVLRFYDDHHYMPWGDPASMMTTEKVGADALTWTGGGIGSQQNVMKWLTGDNPMKESYLQIPEKSRKDKQYPMTFTDPWSTEDNPQEYRIGLDRDMDGRVLLSDTKVAGWDGRTVKEKVLVYSLGPEGEKATSETVLSTFDVVE